MSAAITSFRGEYEYLSNFFKFNVVMDGMVFPSVEHAYQAAKTLDSSMRERIRDSGAPYKAKKMGKHLAMRDDWESVKEVVMEKLLRQKFSSPTLCELLLETGNSELVEGNEWGDREWGCVLEDGRWEGKNKLGRILMSIRDDLQKGQTRGCVSGSPC